MIVLIDGLPASGKSLVRGMLDNHSKVFSCPFHDLLPLTFTSPNLDYEALKAKDTEWLRSQLSKSARYYRIERIASQEEFHFDIGGGEVKSFPVNLDFYSFDRMFMSFLRSIEEWTPQNIIEACYKVLNCELYGKINCEKRVYATLGNGEIHSPRKFLERFPDGKVIYFNRDIESIVAALCERPPQPGNYRTRENEHKKIFKNRIVSGIVQESLEKKIELDRLFREFPVKVLLLDFDSFFDDFEVTKKKIAHFLGIPVEKSMDEFSFIGSKMPKTSGSGYFDKPIDNKESILSSDERNLIGFLYNPTFTGLFGLALNREFFYLAVEAYLNSYKKKAKNYFLNKFLKKPLFSGVR
ncbi:hypothetical protein RSO68_02385 [Halomonas saccharevitans]|uniref:Sulfotransferase family protein n=1 Tax=Halomonas saccharevitans TaxID=416872 RepID=A0ABU3NB88_9GAMM|nr:hypothetical protein [Halomonas saccharevitans]MDT8878312.1 hypothetical protein [Halomonas saccharevitans]